MVNRRKFLQGSVFSLISASVSFPLKGKSGRKVSGNAPARPVVAATWDNRNATEAGMKVLLNGGSALDAVEAGARIPEGDPEDTSVGFGGYPDREGRVTLDACIMDEKGNAGAVTYLQHIKHPISVARKVMEKTPHVMLTGDGALQFALEQGFEKENLLTDHAEKVWKEWASEERVKPGNHDTIGILALDDKGNICGACSTSGLAFKMPGRVGDSPIIGAGMYVDNEIGGACATGVGELVMKIVGSYMIVEMMRQGNSPLQACRLAVERIIRKYPEIKKNGDTQVGFLALNKQGEVGGYSVRKDYSIAVSEQTRTYLINPDFHIR
ncbi:MAG: N(4)-(beta-N-acetylglucosaminyl)-L-asparaginase [Cyclobacteriaceae bacterium]|nr:N(4)-(beta-N-acetylglucosaminyl)-L-asparaginase [Cyclobacteriaceae bacterium]